MQHAAAKAIDWTEQGLVPDTVIRSGIRRLLKQRLTGLYADDCERVAECKTEFVRQMCASAITPLADKANEQHYEVPSEFFLRVLGDHNKYSCCHWRSGVSELTMAEEDGLRLTCEHAGLQDGMDILELGCGWGSLTLWMAKRYPNSSITAVSNSHSQREHITQQATQLSLKNIQIITADMNDFSSTEKYDRIVSVEMFEHMRNYHELFHRISAWLKPGGGFFMHIFCHRDIPYAFDGKEATDWMSKHFFSGGMMPSDDLPLFFQDQLRIQQYWRWSGQHYEKTANAWLLNMDRNKHLIWPILQRTYGAESTQQWWMRWRMFFMACAELFGYEQGQQWWVSHYLFEKSTHA